MRAHARTVRTFLGVAAAVLLAGSAVVGSAGPAAADREVATDPAGDVVDVRSEPTRSGGRGTSLADQADIVRVVTVHGRRTISITVDLVAIARDDWGVAARIRTEGGDFLLGHVDERGRRPFTYLVPRDPDPPRRGVVCDVEADVTADVRRRQDQVVLTLPRRCVGAGERIRTGIAAVRLVSENRGKGDDARRRGRVSTTPGEFALGPPVARG